MGWSADAAGDLKQAGELARKGMSHPDLTPQERRLGEWLLAYVYASEGDFAKSMNSAEAAIALAPRDAFMYADLAQMPIWARAAGQGARVGQFRAEERTRPRPPEPTPSSVGRGLLKATIAARSRSSKIKPAIPIGFRPVFAPLRGCVSATSTRRGPT